MQKTITETIKLTPNELTEIIREKFGKDFSVYYDIHYRCEDGYLGAITLTRNTIKPV